MDEVSRVLKESVAKATKIVDDRESVLKQIKKKFSDIAEEFARRIETATGGEVTMRVDISTNEPNRPFVCLVMTLKDGKRKPSSDRVWWSSGILDLEACDNACKLLLQEFPNQCCMSDSNLVQLILGMQGKI